jgi:hypothetical protein
VLKIHLSELRARVFISCGQAKETDEVQVASGIASRLQELGFDPYVAVQEQTLRGIKENIFGQLSNSEYFIFVDFKRDRLGSTKPPLHRGSLFSHQELAIASFLDIPVLAMQESGVKQDDGILHFLQANAISFTDRHLLPNVIADKVQERGWDPRWRNQLILELEPAQFSDANRVEYSQGQQRYFPGRFFHIDVRNLHRDKTATNCYAYMERAINLDTSTEIPVRAVEFKWAGYILPNANIPPATARRFDAFWIAHDLPTKMQFNVYSDATDYIPAIEGEGQYELSYLILADNFPPSRRSFILTLSKSLALTRLAPHP